MAGLARQLLYAPPDKRVAQVQRAERLHDQIDAGSAYPADFVHFKITGYRSEGGSGVSEGPGSGGGALLNGEDLLCDLRVLIGALSKTAPLAVTDDEPVESGRELAARLGVTGKTVARWREIGLRWRWVRRDGAKRKQVGYTQEAVALFLKRHEARVARAARMTQLDAGTKRGAIEEARQIAQAEGASLNAVAGRLAKKLGRAHQTLRFILEHHDRDHPERAIFAARAGGQTGGGGSGARGGRVGEVDRKAILKMYRGGLTGKAIAERYGCDRSMVYRVVRRRRMGVLDRLRVSYVPMPVFEREDADTVILRETPVDVPGLGGRVEDKAVGLPEPLAGLFEREKGDAKLHRSLLIRMNYLKYKVVRGREGLNRYDPSAGALDRIERWARRAGAIRDWNFMTGLPLVLSVARRHMVGQADQSPAHLAELLEAGVGPLAEAVERYDPGGRQGFGEYVTWRLMKQFAMSESDSAGADSGGRRRARRRLSGEGSYQRIRAIAGRWGIRVGRAV